MDTERKKGLIRLYKDIEAMLPFLTEEKKWKVANPSQGQQLLETAVDRMVLELPEFQSRIGKVLLEDVVWTK